MTFALIIGWFSCGVLAYGIFNGDYKWSAVNEWGSLNSSTREIMGFLVVVILMGPIGFIASILATNFVRRGVTWKSWETKRGVLQ